MVDARTRDAPHDRRVHRRLRDVELRTVPGDADVVAGAEVEDRGVRERLGRTDRCR